jgi:hypothetical protein
VVGQRVGEEVREELQGAEEERVGEVRSWSW